MRREREQGIKFEGEGERKGNDVCTKKEASLFGGARHWTGHSDDSDACHKIRKNLD
jgi:hypothetical protein